MKFAIVTLVALAAHAFAEPAAIGTDPDFARPRNVRRWSGPSRQGPDGPHIVDDSSSVVGRKRMKREINIPKGHDPQTGYTHHPIDPKCPTCYKERAKREINIPKGHDPVTGYTHHPIDPKCPTCNKKRVKRDVDTTPDQGGKRAKRDVNIPKGYDPIDPYHHPPLPGQGGKRAKRDVDAVTIDEGPHPIGRKRDVDAVTIDEGPHPIGRKREINIPKGPDPLGRYKHKPIDPNCPLCNKKRVKRDVDEQVKREVDIAPPPHKSPPDVPGKRDLDAVAIDEVSGDVGKRGVVPKGKKSPPTDIPGGNGRVKRQEPGRGQYGDDGPGGGGKVKRQEPGRGQYGDDGPGGGGK